jgi:type IV pilus assembly protein PilW
MCANLQGARRRQQGLSIVELMVGILVAMLVGLAAAGSALFFNASQRQGMSAGGATVAATITLASIKEDASQAGLGFFADQRYLCNGGLNLSVATTDLTEAAFAPLVVSRDDDGVDSLQLVYATQVAGGADVLLANASNGASADVASYLPATAGDVDAGVPPSSVLLGPAGDDATRCTVRTVTDVDDAVLATKTPQRLTFAGAGAHNQVNFGALAYPLKGRVLLLGDLQWHNYYVENGNLMMATPLTGAAPVALIQNVVAFRVLYGVTAAAPNATSIVDWVEPDTVDMAVPAQMVTVRALHIGVTTRGDQPEKPVNGSCVLPDTEQLNLLGYDFTPPDVGGVAWNCFRYRNATVVVPLRNIALGMR